ncbi:unnamed protein product, partial [Heterotrigona itama]
MLATNGESSLVGHCHVNSLRRRFTTSTRDPRSHSQLPKVRLASRSQQKFFAKRIFENSCRFSSMRRKSNYSQSRSRSITFARCKNKLVSPQRS